MRNSKLLQFGTIFTPLRLNDDEPRCSHQALFVSSDLNVTRPKLRRSSRVPFWREGEMAIPVLQSGANIYSKHFQCLSAEAKEEPPRQK